MKKKALCLIFGTALTSSISVASADEEPLTLSTDQMDQVTAAAGGLLNLTDGLKRVTVFQSGHAHKLFASLANPTDETVETPFGSINSKIAEIRERIINRDIKIAIR